jgi:hypothetical protein
MPVVVIPATCTATQTVLIIKLNAVNTSDGYHRTSLARPIVIFGSADSGDLADQDIEICLRQSWFMTQCKDLLKLGSNTMSGDITLKTLDMRVGLC